MQNIFLPKEILRSYMEGVVLIQDVGSLLSYASQSLKQLFPDTMAYYWLKREQEWFQLKVLEPQKICFERGKVSWQETADLLLSGLQTELSASDGILFKMSCNEVDWGVVFLSPLPDSFDEETMQVARKLVWLLAQQLLPMLEEFSPRQTALHLLKKDALILFAEEIKTPLSLASVAAQTVEAKLHYAQQAELEEKCGQLLRILDQNLRKAIRASDNVLQVGRLESGYAQPEWHSFDLNEFLEELFRQVVPYAASESVDFTYQSNLTSPQLVITDMEYVERIVLNLISNAIKGCRRCERRGEIRVTAAVRDEQISITVRDNGVGIPREDLPHVFEKFWQPSNADCERRGTGMGLYLAHLLTKQLKGRIWAESARQGVCFTLCVPAMAQRISAVTSVSGGIRKDLIAERLKTELCEFLPMGEF
ncbi:sensor histidine kinase [uncultured Ruthenibacterium sp.]|uniref:sensor histidine kinase n=1 Tax=uncultured Ruthenibacterium sp. TaxID=1905347 RepID=UPI00349EDAE3